MITNRKLFQETILTISSKVIIYVQACVLHKSAHDSNDSDLQNSSLAAYTAHIGCQYLERTPCI